MILLPANWAQSRREYWNCLIEARVIENQVYMVEANCIGKIGGVIYSRDSCVINSDGLTRVKAVKRLILSKNEIG